MKLTWEEMKDIAKRLPVGFYLGRKTPVTVEESGGAYCDVVKGDVHIGMTLLQTAADKIDASDAAKWDREKLLRCLLYHEIGHLLLTPDWLGRLVYGRVARLGDGLDPATVKELANIFEDERLECILSQVFMGVDFKAFCRLVHKGVKEDASSLASRFLFGIRLRQTTAEISDAVDDAIQHLAPIDSRTDTSDQECHGVVYADYAFVEYDKTLAGLVEKFVQPSEEKPQQSQPQQGQQSQPQDKDKNEGKGKKEDGAESPEGEKPEGGEGEEQSGEDGEQPEQPEERPAEEAEESEEGDSAHGRQPRPVSLPEGFLKGAASRVFVEPSADIAKTLAQFAARLAKKRGAQAAGCWSALHGKIDTRRDAMDKERIFRRQSDVGDRLMSSVNLTLWVDNSGSFWKSGPVLNQILSALARAVGMSHGKLAANVVTMDSFACVRAQENWFVAPDGNNDINSTYSDAWRKTRARDRRNIDIVVFDGRAAYARPDVLAIVRQIWENPDCHIISDTSNKDLFMGLKKAHVTFITKKYAECLRGEVMKTLDRIL